jgi:hypothetical protein
MTLTLAKNNKKKVGKNKFKTPIQPRRPPPVSSAYSLHPSHLQRKKLVPTLPRNKLLLYFINMLKIHYFSGQSFASESQQPS